METKQIPSYGMPRVLRILFNFALLLSLLGCTWLLCGAVAAGWIMHADHYGEAFALYGYWLLGLAGGMTAAVILYFCRLDLIAAVLGTVCCVPMAGIVLHAMEIAEQYGWSGQTEQSFGVNAAEVWRSALIPNLFTLGLLLLLTLTRYFSYDARAKRKLRRDAREKEENRPAPSILGD